MYDGDGGEGGGERDGTDNFYLGAVSYFLEQAIDASFATIKRGGTGRSHELRLRIT